MSHQTVHRQPLPNIFSEPSSLTILPVSQPSPSVMKVDNIKSEADFNRILSQMMLKSDCVLSKNDLKQMSLNRSSRWSETNRSSLWSKTNRSSPMNTQNSIVYQSDDHRIQYKFNHHGHMIKVIDGWEYPLEGPYRIGQKCVTHFR